MRLDVPDRLEKASDDYLLEVMLGYRIAIKEMEQQHDLLKAELERRKVDVTFNGHTFKVSQRTHVKVTDKPLMLHSLRHRDPYLYRRLTETQVVTSRLNAAVKNCMAAPPDERNEAIQSLLDDGLIEVSSRDVLTVKVVKE